MSFKQTNWKRIAVIFCSALTAFLILVGCSSDSSSPLDPVSEASMFNPERGFQIESGREIPFLNDNYWESQGGSQTNPFLFGLVSRFIGVLGGTVQCGNHSYSIPAGALSGMTRMTMAYASLNTVAVDCGPSPLSFLLPVTLTLSYAGTQYDDPRADPSQLRIWYMSPDGEFIPLNSTVNTNTRTVTAPVTHFSRYILG